MLTGMIKRRHTPNFPDSMEVKWLDEVDRRCARRLQFVQARAWGCMSSCRHSLRLQFHRFNDAHAPASKPTHHPPIHSPAGGGRGGEIIRTQSSTRTFLILSRLTHHWPSLNLANGTILRISFRNEDSLSASWYRIIACSSDSTSMVTTPRMNYLRSSPVRS